MIARLALAVLLATAFAAAPSRAQDAAGPVAAAVASSTIERFDFRTPVGATFGKLVFLGGLQLTSSDSEFGGLSGLRLDADGRRFTMISDRGMWFRGDIAYEGSRPVGMTSVTRVATPGRDGKPLPGRRGFDTEGLEIDGRTAWVTTERVHWLTRYSLDAGGYPEGPGKAMALPKGAERAASNGGYEAIARLPSGALVIMAQNHRDLEGAHRGYVVGGKAPFAFAVTRTDDFVPTDLTRLPGGDLVLLERLYKPPFSHAIRLKRLAEADIKPDATIDGPVLLEATLAQTIDNFEGVSAHRGVDGRTVLTVVSDDNFSPIQRTLLMQFALTE